MTNEVIDGYCHCGISKYLPMEDVERVMQRFGVTRAVLVQHLGEYDNDYIESIVKSQPTRFAGAFLVEIERPDVLQQLDRWSRSGVFRGIRLLAHTLSSHPHVWRRAAEARLNIVVYDEPLAGFSALLGEFAKEHAEMNLVLSHLGMPDRETIQEPRRFDGIASLAKYENIFVQISGMHMFSSQPDYEDLVGLVEKLTACFGTHRLLYGSNFPVMKNETLYGREIELIATGRLGTPTEAAEQILCATAKQLWFN